MQKKLIALAIAGISGAAFAQSNVTISGQMKVSFENVSAGGSTVGGANLTSRARVVDDNSNIRFAGEESLGNGNAAWFQIESAVGTNDNVGTTGGGAGSTATRSTNVGSRNTAVGLKGNWGMALMGKWDVHYSYLANVDGAGLTDGLALATNALNFTQTINGAAVGGSGRDNNVIAYVTPNWNGFSALIGYTTVSQTTAARLAAKDKGWVINPKYSNGPIDLAWSYLNVKNAGAAAPNAAGTGALTSVAATGTCPAGTTAVAVDAAYDNCYATVAAGNGLGADVKSNKIGGAYTFPFGLKVGLLWDKSKVTAHGLAGDTWADRKVWALPVTYTTGAHKVFFTWAKASDVSTQAGSAADTGARMYMLAYQYSLSKRTSAALSWTAINNDRNAVYDYWHPSSSVSGGAAVPAGSDPRKLSLTVRHTF